MKWYIVIALLMLNVANSQEKAPAPFEDSSIERVLKDGKTQKFDGNEYMVVKRGVVKKTPEKETTPVKPEKIVIVKEKKIYKKNAIKGYLGYGPSDLKARNRNTVDLQREPFIGIGYERMVNEKIGVEAIGTTNESLMIGLGYHF